MNIPTAEEFLVRDNTPDDTLAIADLMVRFAQAHVEAALKAAAEKAIMNEIWNNNDWDSENPVGYTEYTIDKESILNAYPKENIK